MLKRIFVVLISVLLMLMLFCGCVSTDDMSIVPGDVYASAERIYTNEWHNGWMTTLDGKFIIEENAIKSVSSYGEEKSIAVEKWDWQEFPYSEEEWNSMFLEKEPIPLEQYGKIMYQPLGDFSFMLLADGDIWLVFLNFVNTGSDCPLVVWSIDRLEQIEE